MRTTDQDIHKGLVGVVVDTTAVSKVDPESNSLLYRGYPVQELAARCSFEEVTWLLWQGELPSAAEAAGLASVERAHRALRPEVRAVIDLLPVSAHPMDVVRTAVSALGALDPEPDADGPGAILERSVLLWAALPAIVAYAQRRRQGQEPIEPRADLDYPENFLWMTLGDVPAPVVIDAFRVSLILYAEHSFNASTFTARVVTSTLSDVYSAVTAAVGALKGPLHGGANEAVLHVLDEIGIGPDAPARAEAWLGTALGERRKVMGFGHRVYKTGDSRVPTMDASLRRLAEHEGADELIELYDALAAAMRERTGILPNLDYPSGPAYRLMGFETEIFTPLFVAARVVGWTAHVLEQRASNALIRPLSAYVGAERREVPQD
ncbi:MULTISPECIES: bifunctional 2-methylcitrate synthase/citrate synthase [unclassified Rathayibacter]|uniref:bifunctional 2-methylcitrate synthase/citrate synthase n=1 Tax=unclassified Rathayibacter TaxID=2609250 RepID=UPI00188C8AEF|nr:MULTISPECIES: bifunctional 2-methylcitrate synthase/citrate synthase [unclassified Rathayibacter]MBF4462228.1 bifunctional 2-methylcitrate synthase/citrate synthase [Rathayibacter sp. VKM Ac-2879]MBF4503729.1 bifunctional 2-methylcitrate synthase/citrate synthase [Rathayibacter sp. VKM Ac-2878]